MDWGSSACVAARCRTVRCIASRGKRGAAPLPASALEILYFDTLVDLGFPRDFRFFRLQPPHVLGKGSVPLRGFRFRIGDIIQWTSSDAVLLKNLGDLSER
eukprot:5084291-Pleurochrysis_carterae.AAC.1